MALLSLPTMVSAQEAVVPGNSSSGKVGRYAIAVPVDALRVGDKLKIIFYESLQSEEDRWSVSPGQQNALPKNFFQRPELTGEYLVGSDGAISLPLLGRFPVRGQLPGSIEASLLHSYENLVSKKGFVNILSIEHQPIYVTGSVKNAGSFEYAPGMTVLHAVAAAGGMQVLALEPWQRVEMKRQVERLRSGLDELKRLAARTDVLRSERNDAHPPSIATFASKDADEDMLQMLREEAWQRDLVNVSRDAESNALEKAVRNAQADLELRTTRVGTYDDNIQQRRKRLASIENLAKNRLIGAAELNRAQSELTDAEDRKQQAVIDMETATQRLAVSRQDVDRHSEESKIEIEKSMSDAQRGMSSAVQGLEGDLAVFQAMVSGNEADAAPDGSRYEIVRHAENGSIIVEPADEETLLQPGDLVRVH